MSRPRRRYPRKPIRCNTASLGPAPLDAYGLPGLRLAEVIEETYDYTDYERWRSMVGGCLRRRTEYGVMRCIVSAVNVQLLPPGPTTVHLMPTGEPVAAQWVRHE